MVTNVLPSRMPIKVEEYVRKDSSIPYKEWFDGLSSQAAAKVTVAEVEEMVEQGAFNPDHIHTPGIFVKRIVKLDKIIKHIEQRTTRKRAAAE